MKKFAGLMAAAALIVTVGCGQTDSGITTAVKSKLAADDMVKAYQVDVDTSNKVVTLRGEVETPAQREHAIMIARNTDGVTDVIDQLQVTPTAATTGRLDTDADADVDLRGDVDVDVDNNVEGSARRGAEAVKDGVQRGAEEVKDGAEKAGDAIRDAVTDDDK